MVGSNKRLVGGGVIRRKFPRQRRGRLTPVRRQTRAIHLALSAIAEGVGAKGINVIRSRSSVFNTKCAAVLERAKEGAIEIVYLGGHPFVILGARQFLALVESLERT